jgi:hypothetical protein
VNPLGLYVHVPFCGARCGCCSFATWDDRADRVDACFHALGRELAGRCEGRTLDPVGSRIIVRADQVAGAPTVERFQGQPGASVLPCRLGVT